MLNEQTTELFEKLKTIFEENNIKIEIYDWDLDEYYIEEVSLNTYLSIFFDMSHSNGLISTYKSSFSESVSILYEHFNKVLKDNNITFKFEFEEHSEPHIVNFNVFITVQTKAYQSKHSIPVNTYLDSDAHLYSWKYYVRINRQLDFSNWVCEPEELIYGNYTYDFEHV